MSIGHNYFSFLCVELNYIPSVKIWNAFDVFSVQFIVVGAICASSSPVLYAVNLFLSLSFYTHIVLLVSASKSVVVP
jgi:hypothetical protein